MKMGKKIGIGIRLVIMVACYFAAVRWDANVQDAARIAMVTFSGSGLPAGMAKSIYEAERESEQELEHGQKSEPVQEPEHGQDLGSDPKKARGQEQGQEKTLSLCFWHEQEDVWFSCKETGKTAQATRLLIEGDPELVAKGCGILAWVEKGCVMDDVTAQELFGTRQVNGQIAWCDGEAYTVYGTFESLERTVVLRAGNGKTALSSMSAAGLTGTASESLNGASTGGMSSRGYGTSSAGAAFDHISIKAPQGVNVKTEAEQLLMRCGLSGDIADFTFPGIVCGNLLLVLPILLTAGLVKILWGCLKEDGPDPGQDGSRKRTAERVICAALLLVSAATLFFWLREHLQISPDMIPTKWSDFSFWPQWWAGQKANLLQILGGAQGEMQLEALWSCGCSVVFDMLAIAAGISFLHAER